jgi:hypothetical protein
MGVNSAEEPFLVFWRVDRFVSGRQSVYGVTLLLGNQECDALRAVFPSMNFQDMDFATIWTACIDTSRFRGTRAAAHLFSVLGFS